MKKHLFLKKHELDNRKDYFYPDYEVGQSWQRLMGNKGRIQPHDITLLHHENYESRLMVDGMAYSEAHGIAEKEYNYAMELKG
ncbi:hypothetical protein LQZ18_09365 [Lachnospiraceae bacterium ZAX-1]